MAESEFSHLGRVLWFLGSKCTYFLLFLLEKVLGGSYGNFALILDDQKYFLKGPSIRWLVVLLLNSILTEWNINMGTNKYNHLNFCFERYNHFIVIKWNRTGLKILDSRNSIFYILDCLFSIFHIFINVIGPRYAPPLENFSTNKTQTRIMRKWKICILHPFQKNKNKSMRSSS